MLFTVAYGVPLTFISRHGANSGKNLSYRVIILRDGKPFLETSDYVRQLHVDNTNSQNEWLRESAQRWVTPCSCVDPAADPRDFPVPERTAFILAALNAASPEPLAQAA